MLSLSLSKIAKSYGPVSVIKSADLEIEAGEFVVFVGPSGCGKSTLLRMIAGLEPVSGGDILIGERNVTHLPPIERNVAMVFQSYALYPHMTVGENIAFGLKIAGVPKAERLSKAREAARVLQLEPLFDRKPKQLSGGQRQRVAIGRAFVKKPEIFLFDEPLSNLDAELRVQMRLEMAKLHQDVSATMIYVTHDQVEAMTLADRIVVLRDGNIEQVGGPLELYNDPANEFVAGFIGSPKMNFLDGHVRAANGDRVEVAIAQLGDALIEVKPKTANVATGATVRVGVRPDGISISAGGSISGRVLVAERLGNINYIYADVGGKQLCIESKDGNINAGDQVSVIIDPRRTLLFAEGGSRI